jgi:hypothetical protein
MTNEPENPRARRAAQVVERTLRQLEWEPAPLTQALGFSVDFGPPHLPISSAVFALSLPAASCLLYFNFGFEVPADRRGEVARFITRANWGLTTGAFEMDFDDGQLRFRSSVPFAETDLNEDILLDAIRTSMGIVEAYADAALDVAVRGKGADAAIKGIE